MPNSKAHAFQILISLNRGVLMKFPNLYLKTNMELLHALVTPFFIFEKKNALMT